MFSGKFPVLENKEDGKNFRICNLQHLGKFLGVDLCELNLICKLFFQTSNSRLRKFTSTTTWFPKFQKNIFTTIQLFVKTFRCPFLHVQSPLKSSGELHGSTP